MFAVHSFIAFESKSFTDLCPW